MPFSIMYPLIPVLAVLMYPAGDFPETGIPRIDRNIGHAIDYYSDELNFVDRFDKLVLEDVSLAEVWDGGDYDEPGLTFDVLGYVSNNKKLYFNQRLNYAVYRYPGQEDRSIYTNFQIDTDKKEIYIDIQNNIGLPWSKKVLGSYNEEGQVSWKAQSVPKCTYTRFKYRVDRIVHQLISRKFSSYDNFWEFTCEFLINEDDLV